MEKILLLLLYDATRLDVYAAPPCFGESLRLLFAFHVELEMCQRTLLRTEGGGRINAPTESRVQVKGKYTRCRQERVVFSTRFEGESRRPTSAKGRRIVVAYKTCQALYYRSHVHTCTFVLSFASSRWLQVSLRRSEFAQSPRAALMAPSYPSPCHS